MRVPISELRSLATGSLWVGTVGLAILFFLARHIGGKDGSEALPSIGVQLSVDSIQGTFGLQRPLGEDGEDTWILVVSSSCPACLALGHDLDQIKRAATCAGAAFVTLVVDSEGNWPPKPNC